MAIIDVTAPTDAEPGADYFYFARDSMRELGLRHAEAFQTAKPFPHVVIDDFLPLEVARRIAATFPDSDYPGWRLTGPGDAKHSNDRRIEKLTTGNEETFPPYIRHVMYGLQSGVFCDFLSRLTGIEFLAPDPGFHGCGLHSTGRGGRLMVHVDASRHPDKKMSQVINCLYYCTPDWKPEYGGALELWNEDASACVTKIEPLFNRMAVFFTGRRSFHGHPHPLTCPDSLRRNSLATYYYTTDKTKADIDYTNYVQWVATNEHDAASLQHRLKSGMRKYLPASVVNQAATWVRRLKR
ncbi:2OG-Fe(II) oxygenase [Algihabitans sp.]|uniref:2OG-Fe(II) oxygenase n=1 Tax=Algihabitans sp. TaxID=2821514 RepID=UPI003BAB6385